MSLDTLEPKEKTNNIAQQHSDEMFDKSGNPAHPDLKKLEEEQGNLYRPGTEKESLAATEEGSPNATNQENRRRGLYKSGAPAGSRREKLLAKAKGMSTGKKVAFAGAGTGLAGLIVVLVLFMLFASGFGVEHLARVLRDAAYSGMHLANYRRTTQYFVQESMERASVQNGGRLNQLGKPTVYERLRGYNPSKALTNLGNEGTLTFVFEDGRSSWRPGSNKKLLGITIDGRTVMAPDGGLNPVSNWKQNRAFMNEVQDAIDTSDKFATESRFIRSRTGRDVSKAAGFELYAWEKKGRSIKNFADFIKQTHARIKGDRVNSVIPEVNEAADEVDKGIDTATPEDYSNGTEDFRTQQETNILDDIESRNFGGAAGAVRGFSLVNLVGTLYCSAHDYLSSQEELTESKIAQAKQSAALLQSSADQFKNGDTTGPAIDASARLYSEFESSYAYQSKIGTEAAILVKKEADLTKDDLPKPDNSSPIYYFYTGVKRIVEGPMPGPATNVTADRVCPIVLKPEVQVTLAVLEVLATAIIAIPTGGGGAAVTQGGREGVEEMVKLTFKTGAARFARTFTAEGGKQVGMYIAFSYILGKLAGTDSPVFNSPEQAIGKTDMGTQLLANDQALAMGGRELTSEETVVLHKFEKETRLAQLHKKPLFYRLASLDNSYSPATQLAVGYPANLGEAKEKSTSLAMSALNPLSSISSSSQKLASATSLSSEAALAAESDDILKNPVKKIGFSVEEMNKMLEATYWPRDNSSKLEPGGDTNLDLKKLDEKYGKCFEALGVKSSSISERDGDCSAEKLSTDDAFRYRLYRLDGGMGEEKPEDSGDKEGLLGQLIDLQDVQADYTDGGNSNDTGSQEPTGDPLADDSSGTQCASGTRDLGIRDDAYTKGKKIKVRLCALSIRSTSSESVPGSTYYVEGANGNAIVNSVASGPWQRLINGATSAGIPISASSSWRTMRHQQDLCNGNANCRNGRYNAVARPGYSNHQAGSAIDIDEAGFGQGAASGRNCSNPQTVSSATYSWLAQNANGFGIKQYANESWHWGMTEAC